MAKLLITFTSLVLLFFCCFFVSSQKISPQDTSYTYEETIEGLKLYTTNVNHLGNLMIWMVFDDKKNDSCILPYVYLRIIDKIGQINYIDLNYTFPVEAACPISMKFVAFRYNYILISYVKSVNGVNERHGLLINYSSEIIR